MLTFNLLALSALDSLPLDALGALDPLNVLALYLRPFSTLDALAFDARPLGTLDALAFDARPLGALDSLPLNLWSLSPLGTFRTLPFRPLWTLGLVFALARLRTFAAITAVALGVGRAGQREAGDAGNQEELGTHDFTRSIRTFEYQRTRL